MAVAVYADEFTLNEVGQDKLDKLVFDKTAEGGWGEPHHLVPEEDYVPAFMQLENQVEN
jgi:hypothetical protein